MARARAANAPVRHPHVRGIAQSLARPTYRRLLKAEPILQRAVPILILVFLITVGIGALMQINDGRARAVAIAKNDIELLVHAVTDDLLTAARRDQRLRGPGAVAAQVRRRLRPQRAGQRPQPAAWWERGPTARLGHGTPAGRGARHRAAADHLRRARRRAAGGAGGRHRRHRHRAHAEGALRPGRRHPAPGRRAGHLAVRRRAAWSRCSRPPAASC